PPHLLGDVDVDDVLFEVRWRWGLGSASCHGNILAGSADIFGPYARRRTNGRTAEGRRGPYSGTPYGPSPAKEAPCEFALRLPERDLPERAGRAAPRTAHGPDRAGGAGRAAAGGRAVRLRRGVGGDRGDRAGQPCRVRPVADRAPHPARRVGAGPGGGGAR